MRRVALVAVVVAGMAIASDAVAEPATVWLHARGGTRDVPLPSTLQGFLDPARVVVDVADATSIPRRGDHVLFFASSSADVDLAAVDAARTQGAAVFLVTPGPDGDDAWDAARRAGLARIDLHADITRYLDALAAARERYFATPAASDGIGSTHRANTIACLLVADWRRTDPAIDAAVRRDTDCGAAGAATGDKPTGSRIAHERDFAQSQPGPHGGAGDTTAHPFFADAGLGFALRKRVLHRGAGIGLHAHRKDEIYYVLSGRGIYVLDGRSIEVGPGHVLLTRPGSTHAIRQDGDDDLVLLIAFDVTPPASP